MPPQAAPLFDQVIRATRSGLANTLHELFLYAAGILVIALVASLFLKEVPISRQRQPALGETPAVAKPRGSRRRFRKSGSKTPTAPPPRAGGGRFFSRLPA